MNKYMTELFIIAIIEYFSFFLLHGQLVYGKQVCYLFAMYFCLIVIRLGGKFIVIYVIIIIII